MEANILEKIPVFLPLSPRRSERRRLLREQDAAASSGDALYFLNNQLAQARFSGPDFQLEGTMVDDFQGDPSAKAGVNDRGRDVGGQAEAGLFASSFHAASQLALQGKSEVLQGSH